MSGIFRIISFTKQFTKWYIGMGLFVVVISLLSLAGPLLTKQIVDSIVGRITGTPQDVNWIIFLLILVIASELAITVLTAISQQIGDVLTAKLTTFLSQKYYRHLLRLHIGYYDNEITGTLVNKLYRGITSITDFIQSMLNNFLPFFLTAFVTIILLGFYSLTIALLLAALFPIYILISHKSTRDWQTYEQEKNKINDRSQGRVFESISGIRVVKAFAAEMAELASFLTARKDIEGIAVVQSRRWHGYDFARRLALNVVLFAIFAYIVYWTFQGRYTIGEMTLLLQLVNQARFPLFAMSFILGQIQMANAGSKDFFAVLETDNKIIDHKQAKALTVPDSDKLGEPLIKFTNVSFEYESKKQVLHDISFVIHPKERFALVGESGQGKSTIVNLLLRFYEPKKGSITIAGQDIALVTQDSLHESIAVVFQESLLFSGTIAENIRYGKPSASMEDVTAAAKAANAYDFITELAEGFNSLIGERGVKLSGGQKQRIAIARAILKDAPIIVLDEATSSLDSKAELEVQKGLDQLLHGRTSIIIAHRLSTIANADHIIVLSGGTVAEYGAPKELLKKPQGLYSQLVGLQQRLLTTAPEEMEDELKQFDLVG